MPGVSTNVEIWSLKPNTVSLFFLPEAVLSFPGRRERGGAGGRRDRRRDMAARQGRQQPGHPLPKQPAVPGRPTAACNDIAPCSLALWHGPLVTASIACAGDLPSKRYAATTRCGATSLQGAVITPSRRCASLAFTSFPFEGLTSTSPATTMPYDEALVNTSN
jgi:hypothetical protein